MAMYMAEAENLAFQVTSFKENSRRKDDIPPSPPDEESGLATR